MEEEVRLDDAPLAEQPSPAQFLPASGAPRLVAFEETHVTAAENEEPALEERRYWPEEEQPDSFEVASRQWAQEEEDARLEKEAEEKLQAKLKQENADREERERIEQERQAARLASEEAARKELEDRQQRNAEQERLNQLEKEANEKRELEEQERLRREEEARQREETARLQQADKARLQDAAEQAAELRRIARQKAEEARREMERIQEEEQLVRENLNVENVAAKEKALKFVERQQPIFQEQQKAPLPPLVIPIASHLNSNHSQLPEPEIDQPEEELQEVNGLEEPEMLSANRLPLTSSSRPAALMVAKLPEPLPDLNDEQLIDDAEFERQKKLRERRKQLREEEIKLAREQFNLAREELKLAKKQKQLNKEQAKIGRNEEFNLGAWLAGAGTADLRECSDSERQKVCAIGYTVLVPTIFSLLSASYAASTLTTNPYVVTLVAVAWAVIILLVDRAIIATYSPNMSFLGKAGTIALRFVVAMLMGMTVSHPLTLLIFKDTITVQIEEQRSQEISEAREKFAAQKKDLELKVAEAQAEVERQRLLYNQSFDVAVADPSEGVAKAAAAGVLTAEEQVLLKQRTDDAAKPFQQELATLETNLQTSEARRAQLQTEMDDWQRQYEAEIGGQRSGVSGIGPRARSIEADQLSWRRADLQRLRDEIASLSARRVEIQKSMTASGEALRREMESAAAQRGEKARRESERLAGLQQQLQEKKLQNLVSEGDNVRKGIQKAIDSGLEELNRRRRELDDLTALELKRMDDLRNNPRRDMLTQTLVMHKMFEHPEAGGHFALAAYIVLAALFLAIDTMPILVKFTAKKGEYDERRERAASLSAVPSQFRKHDAAGERVMRELALEYDRQEQQLKNYEMQAKALEQQTRAFEQQSRVHVQEKDLYEKERDAMAAKADRDAALTFKTLELAERERARQQELVEQERKLALAKQQAELEKLELAAKEAEANEAKAKAHLSKLNLEIVQNDPQGLLKHKLQEAQVARGRERFAKANSMAAEPVAPSEPIAAAEAPSLESASAADQASPSASTTEMGSSEV